MSEMESSPKKNDWPLQRLIASIFAIVAIVILFWLYLKHPTDETSRVVSTAFWMVTVLGGGYVAIKTLLKLKENGKNAG